MEFKLPELGENIQSGQIVNIMVKKGDTVSKEQDLIEIETDKASLPVPSPCDGIIEDILVKEGDDASVGQMIMQISEKTEKATPAERQKMEEKAEEQPEEKIKNKNEQSQPSTTSKKSQPLPSSQTEQSLPSSISKTENIVVLGGGPGGYVAAFAAADLGLNVTLIDESANPGGVCLYRGCIPSKALLHAAKVVSEAKEAKEFGVEFSEPKLDIDKLRGWKNSVVEKLTSGLGQLAKQRKVNFIQGRGSFIDSNSIEVKKSDGSTETVSFDKAILATGSSPIQLPFAPNSKRILDSTSALDIENIPESMLIVGGGYIGLELGCVYAEFGTKIDVVEMLPSIAAGADRDIVQVLKKRLTTLFRDIKVSTKVTKMDEKDNGIEVTFEDKDGNATTTVYEKVLVSIGRRPNSKGIGLENTKVELDDKGFVKINHQQHTSDENILAIGDLAGQPMLAHKASHEGMVAAEVIAGHKAAFEPAAIPAVVFTDPEVAWAGITETEAKERGIAVKVEKFPWGASGRALTLGRSDGLTKILADPETERILGVSIVGPGAGELIAEGVLAIEMGCVAQDLKMAIHAHPTLSETVMEAAEGFSGSSIHMYRPKKK